MCARAKGRVKVGPKFLEILIRGFEDQTTNPVLYVSNSI